jgi:DnaJ like chaperone protein
MTLRTILLIVLGLLIARVIRRVIASQMRPAVGPAAGSRRVGAGPNAKSASAKPPSSARSNRSSGDKERTPHDILGVDRNAGVDEIRAAYQRLAKEYHPDRAATLAPEIQELATRRMSEINRAYETLTKNRPS